MEYAILHIPTGYYCDNRIPYYTDDCGDSIVPIFSPSDSRKKLFNTKKDVVWFMNAVNRIFLRDNNSMFVAMEEITNISPNEFLIIEVK